MPLYKKPVGVETRWASFENPTAGRGTGGRTNAGAKGRAFERVAAGETKTLLDLSGHSGTLRRIWLTVSDRSPEMLRALRVELFWDDAETPAVSAPLGDFFGIGLGLRTPFECALFSDPEGRSFNCFIPMPFRRSARITLTNTSATDLSHLFYDIDLTVGDDHGSDALYFHADWRRESPNALGREFDILPFVAGRGRFLGCNVGVVVDAARYGNTWWGEGEVKIRFGGESDPTLCGTGTEDYIGTAWGQGAFAHRTQGCPIAGEPAGHWAFYRYHIDDPIFFDDGCRVSIQTIGGGPAATVLEMRERGVPLIPVSLDAAENGGFIPLIGPPRSISDPNLPTEGWCNFWREDDWSAVAYYYIDRNQKKDSV